MTQTIEEQGTLVAVLLGLRKWMDGFLIATPSLHSFRRAFAINMLRAGVDLLSLQRLLSHADLSVLTRYNL